MGQRETGLDSTGRDRSAAKVMHAGMQKMMQSILAGFKPPVREACIDQVF